MSIKTIIIIFLPVIPLVTDAQKLRSAHISFNEMIADFNTMNEKNEVMCMKEAIRFTTPDGLCLPTPIDMYFEMNLADEGNKYILCSWDASLNRWIKTKNMSLRISDLGMHKYYYTSISCNGVYGLFELSRSRQGKDIVLPKGYKLHSLRFVQENTKVIYEFKSRIGVSELHLPYDQISALSYFFLDVSNDKNQHLMISELRTGVLLEKNPLSSNLLLNEKTILKYAIDQTLKTSK